MKRITIVEIEKVDYFCDVCERRIDTPKVYHLCYICGRATCLDHRASVYVGGGGTAICCSICASMAKYFQGEITEYEDLYRGLKESAVKGVIAAWKTRSLEREE